MTQRSELREAAGLIAADLRERASTLPRRASQAAFNAAAIIEIHYLAEAEGDPPSDHPTGGDHA